MTPNFGNHSQGRGLIKTSRYYLQTPESHMTPSLLGYAHQVQHLGAHGRSAKVLPLGNLPISTTHMHLSPSSLHDFSNCKHLSKIARQKEKCAVYEVLGMHQSVMTYLRSVALPLSRLSFQLTNFSLVAHHLDTRPFLDNFYLKG